VFRFNVQSVYWEATHCRALFQIAIHSAPQNVLFREPRREKSTIPAESAL
jgi:hypothetical protein